MTPERADAAAARAATAWGLRSPTLLRRSMVSTYASGATVLRASADDGSQARQAIALAKLLAERGVRVPAPVHEDAFVDEADRLETVTVTAWERIEAGTGPVDWEAVGRTVAVVHRLPAGDVAAVHPLTALAQLPWWDFPAMLDDVTAELDLDSSRALRRVVESAAGWHERVGAAPLVVCHGDVHPGNVVMAVDGPVLLDWDQIGLAPRGWDHAAVLTWEERWDGVPGLYRAFAHGYGADLSVEPLTMELARLRLLAATLLRVRAGRADPGAAVEARQRLRWWLGDPAAPRWTPM